MSFLTDLFEGNFDNLGTDLSHAPSSLANDPTELAETLGVGGLIAAPFVLPELGAAFGFGGAAADVGAGTLADTAAVTDATTAAAGAGALGPAADASSAFISDPAIAALDMPAATVGADAGTPSLLASLEGTSTASATSQADLDAAIAQAEGTSTATPTAAATPAATPAATTPAVGSQPTDLAEMQASGLAATPAATTTAAAPAATPGITSQLGSALSSPWTKLALGAAPLALTFALGQPQLPSNAQALSAQAMQMQQTGLTNLAQAQAGILQAGQTAQIQQMTQNLTNQWLQTLKSQGVQDPTKDARWPQILGQIDQQVSAATATLIQNNINAALQETGQAASALTSIAQMQFTADQNFANNIINATKSLGLVAGLGLTTKTTTTTTT